MLQPIEICTHAWCATLATRRQLAREAALVADAVEALALPGHVADRAVAVGELEVVAEVVDATRSERDVDPRELGEQVVVLRLDEAATDRDHLCSAAPSLGALGVLELVVELLVGLLADRAGVEDDHVGVVRIRRPRPCRAPRACR